MEYVSSGEMILVVKIGDQAVNGYRHGHPIDIIDSRKSPVIISENMQKTFALLKVSPVWEDYLKGALDCDIDNFERLIAVRKVELDFSLFTKEQEELWKGSQLCLPLDCQGKTRDLFKTWVNKPLIGDLNSFSSGVKTFGSGGDYVSLITLFADLAAVVTGEINCNVCSTHQQVLTATLPAGVDINGQIFKIQNPNKHMGKNGQGWWVYSAGGGYRFIDFYQVGAGTIILDGIGWRNMAADNVVGVVVGRNTAFNGYYHIKNNYIYTTYKCGCMSFQNVNTTNYIYNNKCTGYFMGSIISVQGGLSYVENNLCLHSGAVACAAGIISSAGVGNFVCNNISGGCTAAYGTPANATGYNNAGDDATCTNGNWGAGNTGNKPSLTFANEFVSTTFTNKNCGRPKHSSQLYRAGKASAIGTLNTRDIEYKGRSASRVSIGLYEKPRRGHFHVR